MDKRTEGHVDKGGKHRSGAFQRFLQRLEKHLAKMSRQQLAATQQTIAAHAAKWQCLDLIEAFGRRRTCCPHCSCAKFYRHGYTSGLQRYRCFQCLRTFTALTGTPFAFLRKRERWLPYLACMLRSLTVRGSADDAGIHRNTSFRWRHRFLVRTKDDRPATLNGIVEVDETYLLESQKGSRHMTRPARRRGGVAPTRGITKYHDCVLVARDRGGATRDWVAGRGQVTTARLCRHLPGVLASDVVLVTDGAQAYHGYVAEHPAPHVALNIEAGIRRRGPYHLQNVNQYHGQFKRWLAPFLGVASRYLPNYLGWCHALHVARVDAPASLLKSALGWQGGTGPES